MTYHYLESKTDEQDRRLFLWQRGNYHYEVEVLDFRANTPVELQQYCVQLHLPYFVAKKVYDSCNTLQQQEIGLMAQALVKE